MMLLILSLLAFMVIDAFGDFYIIHVEKRYIRYATQNLIAAAAYITCFTVAYFSLGCNWQMIVAVAVSVPAMRWNIHDATLNALRNLPVDYLGNRARTDRFLRRLGGHPLAWKLAALMLSFLASFFTYSLLHQL